MSISTVRPILLATAFALAGCGGGGGVPGSASSLPPPTTPAPSQPAAIIATSTSQQFAAVGASHSNADYPTPLLGAGEQLQVRYVQSSNSYEIQVPNSQSWSAISLTSTGPGNFPLTFGTPGGGAVLWLSSGSRQYSRMFEWNTGDKVGYEAIGMATPSSGVPLTGSASYSGDILGVTTEYQPDLADDFPVNGGISLSFNFGLGSLSGSISPNLHQGYVLGTLNFVNTVYSTGSTAFSGKFDTNVPGVNSFSGLFTGPNAQELIGNFAFPYQSPIDGKTYQADGAFVGGK